jgi:VanZ family protein
MGGTAVLLFGVLMETLQWTIYGNQFEWRDVLADAVGIICGLIFLAAIRAWQIHMT